jgi:hypothetical protein
MLCKCGKKIEGRNANARYCHECFFQKYGDAYTKRDEKKFSKYNAYGHLKKEFLASNSGRLLRFGKSAEASASAGRE